MRTRHVFLLLAGCILTGLLAFVGPARAAADPSAPKPKHHAAHHGAKASHHAGKKAAAHKSAHHDKQHATRAAARSPAPQPTHRITPQPAPHQLVPGTAQYGVASWYGSTRRVQRTASGELLDNSAFTAAHLTLPLQSRVRVTNLDNGKSVLVRVTDRGPTGKGRIIDLSRSAAERLDMTRAGIARVSVQPIAPTQLTLLPPNEAAELSP
jgi:rare lipoprotein A